MPDPKIFDEFAQKLAQLLPSDLAQDCQAKFREIVSATFNKLDLVTREEFDAVRAMAQKAREENEALKARLDKLETKG